MGGNRDGCRWRNGKPEGKYVSVSDQVFSCPEGIYWGILHDALRNFAVVGWGGRWLASSHDCSLLLVLLPKVATVSSVSEVSLFSSGVTEYHGNNADTLLQMTAVTGGKLRDGERVNFSLSEQKP